MLWKIWIKDSSDLSNRCQSMYFPQLWIFLWVVEAIVDFEKSSCFFGGFFYPYLLAWFNKFITSLQMCYSFIYPSVCAVSSFVIIEISKSNIIILLSKYLWKVSLMFSILFALEFGARQIILPKMVCHFRCLPVAIGCSELHQIFFVFLSFFVPR